MQEILCTERGLGCNNAVMNSVEGHYEQTFTEVANATRKDGQTVVSADT
jgi:demethoxyubiquinone hydroxylase (CLK1/Coq7/Cat5 family)